MFDRVTACIATSLANTLRATEDTGADRLDVAAVRAIG